MNCTRIAALAALFALSGCATAPPPQPYSPPPPLPVLDRDMSTDGLFAFGEASLEEMSPRGRAQLDAFAAEVIAGRPFEVIHIIGHSDRIGSDAANVDLSNQRARSVREYLIKAGIPAERITAVGRGSVQPVVECEDQPREQLIACLAPNRRVQIMIEYP